MSHPSVRLLPRSSAVVRRAAPFAVWILVWGALNTGGGLVPAFGSFAREPGPFEAAHVARALLPVALLFGWFLLVGAREKIRIRRPSRPECLWLVYGTVGLWAGLTRPDPLHALFWGIAFLVPFAASELLLSANDRLMRTRFLNRLTWTLTGLVLVLLLAASGEQLINQGRAGLSAYGVVTRVETIAGMPAVRASGLGRLAGVVAIVTLVAGLFEHGLRRAAWLTCSAAAWFVVWIMQSRGSLAAAGAGGLFVIAVWIRGESLLASGVFLSLCAGLALSLLPGEVVQATIRSGFRVPVESLLQTSGRLEVWQNAWEAFQSNALVGAGFQADRELIERNAQNGVVYAFVTGGAVGGLAYVGGLALLWHRLIRLLRRFGRLARRNQRTLLQAGGVITLLTVRHFPENTSALYSVDLLILLPALLFVVELDRARRRSGSESAASLPEDGA